MDATALRGRRQIKVRDRLELFLHRGPLSSHCRTARDAGAITINYGLFLENVVNFVIYALFLYIVIKKGELPLFSPTDPSASHDLSVLVLVFEVFFNRSVNTLKQCPICKELVKGGALVCKNCGNKF